MALLTAIAIADDPPGQLPTRIESIVAANENQGNHCFVSMLRRLRVTSEGLGLLSAKAEAPGSDTVDLVRPRGYSLSRGGHDPGS